jgi:hypothetical protein
MSGRKIRNDSAMPVVGWRYGEEYSIPLFYQDQNEFMRLSFAKIHNRQELVPWDAIRNAKSGTPIAASCFNQSIYQSGNV